MHIECIGPFDWCFFSPLESGKANIYLSPAGGESVILYCTGLFVKEPEWVYIYMYRLDISSEKGSSSSSSIYHSIRALVIAYYQRYIKFIFTSILLCFCSISLQSISFSISHARIIFTHRLWFLI